MVASESETDTSGCREDVEAVEGGLDDEDDELVFEDGGVSLLRRADRESRGGTIVSGLILGF